MTERKEEIKMTTNSSIFEITKVGHKPSMNLFSPFLAYDPKLIQSVSYKIGDINDHNLKDAHKKIWELFRIFAEECQSTLSRSYRRKKIEYRGSKGFPTCILPNNTEIICLHSIPLEAENLSFVWLGEVTS